MDFTVKFAHELLSCCGYGLVHYCGDRVAKALPALLEVGFNAYAYCGKESVSKECNEAYPGRCFQVPALDNFFIKEDAHDLADILIIDANDSYLLKVISLVPKMYSRTNKYILLIVPRFTNNDVVLDRSWWQSIFLGAGFRRHPRELKCCSYVELNNDSSSYVIYFEKIHDEALKYCSYDELLEEKLLHMDMLRLSGRRSDAHLARYFYAAQYIRQGDTVLDCACGFGYGSWMMYCNSQAKQVIGVDLCEKSIDYAKKNYSFSNAVVFNVGDAQNLSCLPDNSVDFVSGFETIEHLPRPDLYLKEISRVLRPSGRLMISAPNEWVNEAGVDPNPYHLHVYNWKKLCKEVSSFFILEKGFAQVAGGAMKLASSSRSWKEFPVDVVDADIVAEWILLLGMKTPLNADNIEFCETSYQIPSLSDFNLYSIVRDYKNPWLLKSMVSIGMRLCNEAALQELQVSVLNVYDIDSADYGAALCGYIYSVLNSSLGVSDSQYFELVSSAESYISKNNGSVHLRWTVSLLYAMGVLAKKRGLFSSSRNYFERCAEIDVNNFSPLLGNKTLDALFQCVLFALQSEDFERAKEYLVLIIVKAQHLCKQPWINVIGDVQSPITSGLPELAQIIDKAARAAYFLNALQLVPENIGRVYDERFGFYERILYEKNDYADRVSSALSLSQQKLDDIVSCVQKNTVSDELSKFLSLIDNILPPFSTRRRLFKNILKFILNSYSK
jgi:ubiquinone/menaquinone biosynthesis C-methylase UbiE